MVWVEQSCNLFPRRLHCLQSPLYLVLLMEHSNCSLPDSPVPRAATRGRGTLTPSQCASLATLHSDRARSSPRDRCDIEESGTEHQLHPWATGHCTLLASPVLSGTPAGYQGAQLSDTAWLGHCWDRGRRSQEDAGRSLRAPLTLWHSVQAEMVSPHVPGATQV